MRHKTFVVSAVICFIVASDVAKVEHCLSPAVRVLNRLWGLNDGDVPMSQPTKPLFKQPAIRSCTDTALCIKCWQCWSNRMITHPSLVNAAETSAWAFNSGGTMFVRGRLNPLRWFRGCRGCVNIHMIIL